MSASYTSRSSSASPIGLKKRPDIVVKQVNYQGEPFWVCKDPLDQQYHRLNEQEYAIFRWLDGDVTFDDLKDRFEREFTPYRVELRELTQVVGRFHEKSLVFATEAGQGEQLLEMGREKLRKELKQKATSAHAIKWKGFDPENFLNATNPYVTPLFSARAVSIVLALTALAVCWLLLHYEQVMARAPDLWSFIDPANWVTLGLAIAGSKLLHEFGHAYAFKRFGGEIHEIGVMIFFFMPTMYCNTSDSWMLRDKWARIAVACGGVYVELMIFTLATLVWWLSAPGTFTYDIAINLMFVCSLSAVIVNGNPLLKYDGYFVLSDYFEIPNLSQDSGDQIRRAFMVKCLGIEDEATPWVSSFNRRFLLIYGVAAYLFKMSLMLTVAYFLVVGAAPYGLAPLAFIFATIVTLVFLGMPLQKLWKKLTIPGTLIKIKERNVKISLAALGVILLGLLIPYPCNVTSDCTLDGGFAGTVVTQESGELKKTFFKPGDTVRKGDVIAQLANRMLEKEATANLQQIQVVEAEIANRRHELYEQTDLETSSMVVLQERLVGLKRQQSQFEQRLEALVVRAPIAGRVVGIQLQPDVERLNDERALKMDYGNILVDRLSTWLDSGVEICRICSDEGSWATLAIKHSDQDLARPGQTVKMLFNSKRSRVFKTTVDSFSVEPELPQDLVDFETEGATVKSMTEASMAMAEGPAVNSDGASVDSSVLLGRCQIEATHAVPFGSTGVAKIRVGYRSALWRFLRAVRHFANTKL